MSANPYVPAPWEKIEGWYEVTFTNDKVDLINVKANVTTSYSIPLYLMDVDEIIYNWMNILSMKKVTPK